MKNTILFLGDVLPDKEFKMDFDLHYPYMLNLEGPVSEKGFPVPDKVNIRGKQEIFKKNFSVPPVAVALGNNHITDFGDAAVKDSLAILKKNSIGFYGAGTEEENFNNPFITMSGGLSAGFLSYCNCIYCMDEDNYRELTYRPAPMNYELVRKDILNLKDKVDRIIVQLHWGVEESNLPTVEQVRLGRHLIDLGAHCIIGHHAHAVQPVEKYKHGLIVYGLGNFMFSNFNISCYFDEYGHSKRQIAKKQRAWNKASLGILIDLESMQFDIKYYWLENNKIIEKYHFFHKYAYYVIPENMNKLAYAGKRHLKFKRLFSMLSDYFNSPGIPKMTSVFTFIKSVLQ